MANEYLEDKLYLENLEEEVLQLNNVVTYKWLIRTLKVSANVAKQMLFEFVEKQKAAGIQLNVSYLVSGEIITNGQNIPIHQICIVPASELDQTKTRFNVITSLHIYAVHKAEIKDHNVLYAVDYSPKHDTVMGIKNGCAIRCLNVTLRPVNGSETIKLHKSPKKIKPEEKSIKNPDKIKEEPCKSTSIAINSKKPVKSKGRNQGASLVGMFENMGKKKKEAGKTDGDNTFTVVANKMHDKVDKADKDLDETVLLEGSIKLPKKSPQPPQNHKTTKKEQVKEKQKEVREKRKVKTEMPVKKRRRIIPMSDSSSGEESEPENPIPTPYESSEEEQAEQVEEEVKISVRNSESSERKRCHKRKLVKESGLDEEGFLVTQNNWEDGSGSEDSGNENEDPIPKVKPEKLTNKPEKKVTPKNKQVMLTSFFKKK